MTLQTHDINITHNGKSILQDINIQIPNKKITALMGPSGVGKSTLLNILSGQCQADTGQVLWQQKPLETYDKPYPFGILFQHNALLLHLTVFENVALALRYQYQDEQSIAQRVHARLEEVGLKACADLYPEQLSGGMARRVAIARATIAKPKIMFFDEPFSGLDPPNTANIAMLIKKVNHLLNATTVLVTHEPNIALKLADYVYLLHENKVYHHDTPNKISKSKDPIVQQFINPETIAMDRQ